jgi:hypothetical protein
MAYCLAICPAVQVHLLRSKTSIAASIGPETERTSNYCHSNVVYANSPSCQGVGRAILCGPRDFRNSMPCARFPQPTLAVHANYEDRSSGGLFAVHVILSERIRFHFY